MSDLAVVLGVAVSGGDAPREQTTLTDSSLPCGTRCAVVVGRAPPPPVQSCQCVFQWRRTARDVGADAMAPDVGFIFVRFGSCLGWCVCGGGGRYHDVLCPQAFVGKMMEETARRGRARAQAKL